MDSSYFDELEKSFSVAVGEYTEEERQYLIRKGFLKEEDGEWREVSTMMDSQIVFSSDEEENCEPTESTEMPGSPVQTLKPDTEVVDSMSPVMEKLENISLSSPKSSGRKSQVAPRHSMLLRSVCRKSIAASGANTPNANVLTPRDTNTPVDGIGETTLGIMYKTPLTGKQAKCLQTLSLSEERDVGIKDVPPVPLSESVNSNVDSFDHSTCANCSEFMACMTPRLNMNESLRSDVSITYSATQEVFVPATQQCVESPKGEKLTELDYSSVQTFIHASALSNISSDFSFSNISDLVVDQEPQEQSSIIMETPAKPEFQTPIISSVKPQSVNTSRISSETPGEPEQQTPTTPARSEAGVLEESYSCNEEDAELSFDIRTTPAQAGGRKNSRSSAREKRDSGSVQEAVDQNNSMMDESSIFSSQDQSEVQTSSQQSSDDLDDTFTRVEKLLALADEMEKREAEEKRLKEAQLETESACAASTAVQPEMIHLSPKKTQSAAASPRRNKPAGSATLAHFATPIAPAPKKIAQPKPVVGSQSANVGNSRYVPRVQFKGPTTEVNPKKKPGVSSSPLLKAKMPIKPLKSFLDSPVRKIPAPAPTPVRSPLRKPIVSPVSMYIHSVPPPTQVQRVTGNATGSSKAPTPTKNFGAKIHTRSPMIAKSNETKIPIPKFNASMSHASPTPSNGRGSITPSSVPHCRPSKLNSLIPKSATEKSLNKNVHYVGSGVKPVNPDRLVSVEEPLKSEIIPVANRHLGVRDESNISLVNENMVARKYCPNRFGFMRK